MKLEMDFQKNKIHEIKSKINFSESFAICNGPETIYSRAKRVLSRVVVFISVGLVGIGTTGCSKFKSGPNGAINAGSNAICRIAKSQEDIPFLNEKTSFRQMGSGGLQKATHGLLKEGEKLSINFDLACLAEGTSEFGFFSKQILNEGSNKLPKEDLFESLQTYSVVFESPEDLSLEQIKELADSDQCVLRISNNVSFSTQSIPNDTLFSRQTFHQSIKSDEGWSIFYDLQKGINEDVIIAIIDTGVDVDHEDLKNNLWKNSGEVGLDSQGRNKESNGIDDDKNGYIDDVYGYNFIADRGNPRPEPSNVSFHGTHVAGLAAAQGENAKGGAGVMGQRSKIMSLNVFGNKGSTDSAPVENAIKYAADNGARVINLSLGGVYRPDFPFAPDAVLVALKYAISKGAIIIAAAGNSTTLISGSIGQGSFFWPSSFGGSLEGMIAVSATDSTSKYMSGFSNYGVSAVEIAAPGSNGLLSTMPNNQYEAIEGTSMASPVVAGAAGLVLSLVKSRSGKWPSASEVEKLILQSADKLDHLKNGVKDGSHLNLLSLGKSVDTAFPQTSNGNPGGGTPSPTPTVTPTPKPGTGGKGTGGGGSGGSNGGSNNGGNC